MGARLRIRTNEIWRIVPSLPEMLASSNGRLMVNPHTKPMPNGGTRQYGGEPTIGQWDGARFIYVLNGKTYKVARLVCEAFNGLPTFSNAVCMHLDENSKNNNPNNLAWGTQKQNLNAPGFIAYCHNRTGENSPTFKAQMRNKDSQAASKSGKGAGNARIHPQPKAVGCDE